jgi:hypothetical protein
MVNTRYLPAAAHHRAYRVSCLQVNRSRDTVPAAVRAGI